MVPYLVDRSGWLYGVVIYTKYYCPTYVNNSYRLEQKDLKVNVINLFFFNDW